MFMLPSPTSLLLLCDILEEKKEDVFQATIVLCSNPFKDIKCIANGDNF